MSYKFADSGSIVRVSDGMVIPNNPALAAWQDYQDWLNEGNTPEPADDPIEPNEPNWEGFNAAFLGDVNWQTIATLFSTPDLRVNVASAAGSGNISWLLSAYNFAIADLTAQQIPLDPAVLAGWQAIANANNIPINFEVGNG